MMKKEYVKPEIEVIDLDVSTVLMSQSQDKVDTGLGNTPSDPDATGRRGTWGNLWE